jgi:ribosomal protein S18 acetylase RimI-like enzyme
MIKYKFPSEKQIKKCIEYSKVSWNVWYDHNFKFIKKCEDYIYQQFKNRCIIIAEENDVVGYLIFNKHWNRIHIDDIFVVENYRKCHVASGLMKELDCYCLKNEIEDIFSDIDATNIASINLHLKNKFVICGFIDNYWDDGENSVVLRKKING